ncbi:MAG: PilZ domain-containing protein [Bdellovibrionota bacterium]
MSYDVSRRFTRTEFRLLPWVFALKLDAPIAAERPLRVEARNIGAGGVKFMSNLRIPVFSIVEISLFESKTGKLLLNAPGKVIRVEEVDTGQGEKTFGMAIEFTETAALEALLASAERIQPKKE